MITITDSEVFHPPPDDLKTMLAEGDISKEQYKMHMAYWSSR